jgi:hypothetical protein
MLVWHSSYYISLGFSPCCKFVPEIICLLDVHLILFIAFSCRLTSSGNRIDKFITSSAALFKIVTLLKLLIFETLFVSRVSDWLCDFTLIDTPFSLFSLLSYVIDFFLI